MRRGQQGRAPPRKKGAALASSALPSRNRRHSTAAATAKAEIAPRIIVREEAFGACHEVIVENAPPGESLDREFATYRDARGWAGGLRLTRGWPIRDECGDAR